MEGVFLIRSSVIKWVPTDLGTGKHGFLSLREAWW